MTARLRHGGVFGLGVVAGLTLLAWAITKRVQTLTLPGGIPPNTLEYPLWAVLVGLAANAAIGRAAWRATLQPGFRTELFLKVGLVLLGAGLSLTTIAQAARGAVIQALVLITAVFGFTWWLGSRLHLDDKLRAVMAAAVSICGVSAAIAAAGSVLARKEQVSYVTTLVILVAIPLMLLSPIAANAMGLPDSVAGAWFGGNIDTTAAVVGAGTIHSETAQAIAAIVKSTQNALMGVVAFLLALYATATEAGKRGARPQARILWDRFPKFVLGFVVASILFSLHWIDGGRGTAIEAMKNWSFTAAFVCIGLELSVNELRRMGWAPVLTFAGATVFNTVLALAAAWVIFGIWLPVSG